MTSLEGSSTPRMQELETAFAEHLQRGAVDIVQDEDSGDLEVHSDTWTLAMQGIPPRVAFFAIDDEPTDESSLPGAIDAAASPDDLAALAQFNASLGGALAQALNESGDPLSRVLAQRLG